MQRMMEGKKEGIHFFDGIITVRSQASLGQAESPEAIIETRSPGPQLLAKSPCLQNHRKLPVFQLAVHSEPFLLVITDKQGLMI
jgi:hypothetical protein